MPARKEVHTLTEFIALEVIIVAFAAIGKSRARRSDSKGLAFLVNVLIYWFLHERLRNRPDRKTAVVRHRDRRSPREDQEGPHDRGRRDPQRRPLGPPQALISHQAKPRG